MHPLLANFERDIWAMEPSALQRLFASLHAADWNAGMRIEVGDATDEEDPGYTLSDGLATIPVSGVLMKSVHPIMRAFGIDATGYAEINTALAKAAADPAVDSVMLMMDSPGGTVAGVQALGDVINAFPKNITAHVSDLCASAAYWLASQTDAISASRSAEVGSIGVYGVVRDTSAAHAAAGVTVHVVASGDHKGVGVPGTPVTDEQLAEIRRGITDMAAGFVADVARGRSTSATKINESADGRVWSASDSLARGLIDSITADPSKEYRMSKSIEQMANLIELHPAHALLIAQMAKANATEEAILASITTKDREVAQAKQVSDMAALVAQVADLKASVDVERARADAAVTDATASKAANAALAAHAAGGAAGNKIKSDGDAQKAPTVTRAEFEADPRKYATKVKSGDIKLID